MNNTLQRRDTIQISGSNYIFNDGQDFMSEIRTIPYLNSSLGYSVLNIDSSIFNYKNGKFMLLELKCRNADAEFAQTHHLNNLSASLCANANFIGIFMIQQHLMSLQDGAFIRKLNDNRWLLTMNKTEGGFEYSKEDVFRFIQSSLT